MKYFLHKISGQLFAFSMDGSQDDFITDDLRPASEEEVQSIQNPPLSSQQIESLRLAAYRDESDPLFFKWMAGEIERSEWELKRAEIKARFA